MIPFITYPEDKAKVRVNNLKDQQKHTAKTLPKASTLPVSTPEEPEAVNHATLIKAPLSTQNPATPFNITLYYIQSGKRIDNDTKLVYTGTYSGIQM